MNTNFKRKSHKLFALIICLDLVVLLVVGGTLAYLFTSTEPVTNTFTPVTADIEIDEEFNGTVKENVKVTNSGDVEAYVRAKVVINWMDADNNVLAEKPADATYQIDWAYDGKNIDNQEDVSENESKWCEHNDLYYYTLPIKPDESTGNLIDKVTVSYPPGSTYKLHVEILSQAVQAEPKTAVEELWGVSISEDSVKDAPPQPE